jgi:hypothetical protein
VNTREMVEELLSQRPAPIARRGPMMNEAANRGGLSFLAPSFGQPREITPVLGDRRRVHR